MTAALLTFALPCLLVVLLPGPDTLIVLRGLLVGGRRGGIMTSLGVLCGVLVWVAAAVLGLSAVLHASEVAYLVLKVIGGGYLVWMGVKALNGAWRPGPIADQTATATATRKIRGSGFFNGFLTDVLNPKVGVTFVTLLPAFVPAGESVPLVSFALGLMFVLFSAVYFVVLIALSGTVSEWMTTPAIRRRLDGITGVVLVGFGIRLATEH